MKIVVGAKIEQQLYDNCKKLGLTNTELVRKALRFYLQNHQTKRLTSAHQKVNEENLKKLETSADDIVHVSNNKQCYRYQQVKKEVDTFLSDQSKKPIWLPANDSKKKGDLDR